MHDLDTIERGVRRRQERLVSAVAFTASAAAAGVVVSELGTYFVLVSLGAAGWTLFEGARLRLAEFERESVLDELVLAGSWDPRCERRRADLGSPRLHHRLARMLRETCEQSRFATSSAVWFVDHGAVRAVEHDLRALAAVFDDDAGHLPPAAVALVHYLLASRFSPLHQVNPDPAAERQAIQTTQRIIARCRAELDWVRAPGRPSDHQEASP
ncbi:MAG TPA: hypothetical protein VLB81_16815 [Gaiellales bacterium]|nr:hypothetical protein [Gaiellales bacterium]